VEWEGHEKQPVLRSQHNENTGYNGFAYDLDLAGPTTTTFYISKFDNLDTGDEGLPLFVVSYANSYYGITSFAGRFAVAFSFKVPFDLDNFPPTDYSDFNNDNNLPENSASGLYTHPSLAWGYEAAILATQFNPLQAWTLAPYPAPGTTSAQAATTTSNPLSNEYDLSKISKAPGYNKTESLSFPHESCPNGYTDSGVVYEVKVWDKDPRYQQSRPYLYDLIYSTAPPQVVTGSNWSLTWTDFDGSQKTYSRANYMPDSEYQSMFPTLAPPYVVLIYSKQVGTAKDCKVSLTVEP
jgi:hypothetical protein